MKGGVAGLNEEQFQAGEGDVDRVLSAARTLPMMATRRYVLVRRVARWEPKAGGKAEGKLTDKDPLEKLCDYAKSPSTSTVLVLAGALDKRRKLYTQAKTDGFLVVCQP